MLTFPTLAVPTPPMDEEMEEEKDEMNDYSYIHDYDGSGDYEDDNEPEHATLLALGDRRGFVTVWSTRKSRPIFKLQCSETRCTVTDLAWGRDIDNAMILLVSSCTFLVLLSD